MGGCPSRDGKAVGVYEKDAQKIKVFKGTFLIKIHSLKVFKGAFLIKIHIKSVFMSMDEKPFTQNLRFSGNLIIFYFYCSLGNVLSKPMGFDCCSPFPAPSFLTILLCVSLWPSPGLISLLFFFSFFTHSGSLFQFCFMRGTFLGAVLQHQRFSMKTLEQSRRRREGGGTDPPGIGVPSSSSSSLALPRQLHRFGHGGKWVWGWCLRFRFYIFHILL